MDNESCQISHEMNIISVWILDSLWPELFEYSECPALTSHTPEGGQTWIFFNINLHFLGSFDTQEQHPRVDILHIMSQIN